MGPGCRVSWFNNEAFILIYRSADDKKGYTPPPKQTKGKRIFVDGEVFDVYVVVGITPATLSRMYALPRYTVLHIFTVTASEQPNAQRPVLQAYKHSPLRKAKRHGTPYVPETYLRTASACFIQGEPHHMGCILDRGTIL